LELAFNAEVAKVSNNYFNTNGHPSREAAGSYSLKTVQNISRTATHLAILPYVLAEGEWTLSLS
jgi:hypothetical protein